MSGLFRAIASIFGGGNDYTPPPPPVIEPLPPTPTVDEATASRENADSLRRRKGRAATVLTGTKGAGTPDSATKVLLGS